MAKKKKCPEEVSERWAIQAGKQAAMEYAAVFAKFRGGCTSLSKCWKGWN